MENINYSKEIYDALREFFGEVDWVVHFNAEDGVFRFGVGLECKLKRVDCYALLKHNSYRIYAISPFGIDLNDKNMVNSVNEFLSRANFNTVATNFEFDWNTGYIRAKCFMNCEGLQAPTKRMLATSVFQPAILFEHYGDGIFAVLNDSMSAKEAVEMCDKDSTFKRMLHTLEPPKVETDTKIDDRFK